MPLLSIVTPVFDPPRDAFEACVRSVLEQTFNDWEWCLANDASTSGWVSGRLRELQRLDRRIRVVDRFENSGGAAASNDAVSLSMGEFIVLLNNEDELSPDALQLVAHTIISHPDVDYIYSDEDKITLDGKRYDEFLKPDWSPERLLAQNYVGDLGVLRRSLFERLGRYRDRFGDANRHELVLQVSEISQQIVHVPTVLYHRRTSIGSQATGGRLMQYAHEASGEAVRDHLQRRGVAAEIDVSSAGVAHVRRKINLAPEVTIILPVVETPTTKPVNDIPAATTAVRSLTQRTSYVNYHVIVVAPRLIDDRFIASLVEQTGRPVTVVRAEGEPSRADLINRGLVACETRRAVVFDQQSEVLDADWIQTLLGYEGHERVAMIAPVVVDAGGLILSAGLAMTPTPHHIGHGCIDDDPGPFGMFTVARECFGASTHCALVDVAVLKSVGGLNTDYRTRYHDFDLARKLHTFGFHSIVTPLAHVRSHEHEPQSKSDCELFESRWQWLPLTDPYARSDTRKLTHPPYSPKPSGANVG